MHLHTGQAKPGATNWNPARHGAELWVAMAFPEGDENPKARASAAASPVVHGCVEKGETAAPIRPRTC